MESAAPHRSSSLRTALLRIALLVGAIALGLVAQELVASQLGRIAELSSSDVVQARRELARVLEIASVIVFGLTGSVGVALCVSLRRGLALDRFPPPGIWSWGSARTLTGPRARVMARVGIALGIVLTLASCLGGALGWYMAARLRACRAGMITAQAPARVASRGADLHPWAAAEESRDAEAVRHVDIAREPQPAGPRGARARV